jgi:hypothetical protein
MSTVGRENKVIEKRVVSLTSKKITFYLDISEEGGSRKI